ncbi:CbtB-domain containing protein [Sulfurimonas sp. SAG-AH-194-C20]|nr:CbtB domain-containing protein [Sulfurimonas sp. SAG-AH-194-C20]MDF1878472.1 CbtB-domain containing protein [Sulfurimonas sp. SAG-AH-194-C20]
MNQTIGAKSTTQTLSKTTMAFVTVSVGIVLVYLVALSSPMQLHNAAHDVRHTSAFPCH